MQYTIIHPKRLLRDTPTFHLKSKQTKKKPNHPQKLSPFSHLPSSMLSSGCKDRESGILSMPKLTEIVKATFTNLFRAKPALEPLPAMSNRALARLAGLTDKRESQGHSSVGLAEGQSRDGEEKSVQVKRGRSSTLHHAAGTVTNLNGFTESSPNPSEKRCHASPQMWGRARNVGEETLHLTYCLIITMMPLDGRTECLLGFSSQLCWL